MIFTIKNLKYDTDNMELISDKVRTVEWTPEGSFSFAAKLYKSKKGTYVLVTFYDEAKIINEKKVKNMLFEHDIRAYEKMYGRIEEG